VKAVFFDAGGTLIHIDWARVAGVIAKVVGREVPAARLAAGEYAGRALVEAVMASGDGGSDATRWSMHVKATLIDAGLTETEYAMASPAIHAEHRRWHLWSVTVPGTAEGLAALRKAGWFVACISNADGTVARLLEAAGILPHLEFVVDSGVVGVEKPDPRIFEIALERVGVSAAEAYYVGDVHPIDVVGARRAGMTPVLMDPLGRYAARGCRTAPDVPTFCRELVTLSTAA
jgi:HAD superfamily hydrolase (TIGR01509 family)